MQNQDWIDDINKKLEEQRQAYKESIESGEVERRKKSYVGSIAGKVGGNITGNVKKNGAFHNPEIQKELALRPRPNGYGPGHDFTEEERTKGHNHENSFKNKKVQCSICKCTTTTGNHARWHEDKCKLPILLEVLSKLNETFTRKELEDVTVNAGLSKAILNNIVYGYEDIIFCTLINNERKNMIYKKL